MAQEKLTYDPAIAHITVPTDDGDVVFQVLNADGTDLDEAATRAQYEAWRDKQPQSG